MDTIAVFEYDMIMNASYGLGIKKKDHTPLLNRVWPQN
jgi:hypothetical protein